MFQMHIVLTNTDKGYFYSTTVKLEYPIKKDYGGLLFILYSSANDLLSQVLLLWFLEVQGLLMEIMIYHYLCQIIHQID
jgi:hypothetical protein